MLTNAIYSSFFSYFTSKMNLMMGISQTILIVAIFLTPYYVNMMMYDFGFRKTLWLFTILSALTFITASVLDPVEKHMKKVYVHDDLNDLNSGK